VDTANFNLIDKAVARMRVRKVSGHVDKNSIVLDFGCGSQGYLLKSIAGDIESGIGIDHDVEDKVENNLRFTKYSFKSTLPFNEKMFDVVVMLAVLEHINPGEVDILFREFRRVLKDGGRVIVTTPTPVSKPILELLAYKLRLISEGEIRDHKKYYSKDDMIKLANDNGFECEKYDRFQLGLNSVSVYKKNR